MKTSDFWQRIQRAIEVAVASGASPKLLGVRDGFRRYFSAGLDLRSPIVLVPQPEADRPGLVPLSDSEAISLARQSVGRMTSELGDAYDFWVAIEEGIGQRELEGEIRYFVQTWAVVHCAAGEAWGSSGCLQLPDHLVAGLEPGDLPGAIPATRRSGGMVSSLTGGLETRRSATSIAVLHALSTLFFGKLERRPTEPLRV